MRMRQLLKTAFENVTMCARSHSPQEAYAYSDRVRENCCEILDAELQRLADGLLQGRVEEVAEELKQLMRK